ncbi:GGDEF domain-containing protein [Terriglobus roseus]|nr:GGDEF domain-containing protein [Terriglobus roseus]
MRTLLLERVCLLGFCTLLVVANVREHRSMRGIRWFVASNVNYLIGGILIADRQHLPVWVAVVLANFLYSMGYVFLHRCLSEFLRADRRLWIAQCTVATLSLAQCIYFSLIHPDIRLRLAAIGLATGLQFAICAAVAFDGGRVRIRVAAISMGGVLAFSAALNLTRVLLTLVWGTTQTYLKADDIQTSVVMLNTMIFVAIDIAFVWMIATTLRNELHVQAMTDPLTHVLNRRALELLVATAVEMSMETGRPLSAIAVDLDDFKRINDSLGHSVGDTVLVDTVRSMEAELRGTDSIARVGGDEFVIVLPNCPLFNAEEIAERLRLALEALHFEASDGLRIRASFGVATLTRGMTSWEGLIAKCDEALYAAKNAGGNFVHVT